jgi:acyl dehydratase
MQDKHTLNLSSVSEPTGRWFEDLPVGAHFSHSVRRTITEADNVLFTTMTMNTQPLHLDAEFAAATEFGERLVNSLLTMSLVVGLSVTDLSQGTTIANLGFDEIRFPHPVRHGDTIRCDTTVVSSRPSRTRPDAGIVLFRHLGFNQRDQVVADVRRSGLMRRRPT